MRNLIFSILIAVGLSSCSTAPRFITNEEDGWFRQQDTLLYCRANKLTDDKKHEVANPICASVHYITLEVKDVTVHH